MKNQRKAIVLYSGGLDSRIVIKLLQQQKLQLEALHFKLPFSCSKLYKLDNFLKENKVKLKIFDCRKDRLFEEYLETIKHPKHARGSGINPCIDCKIFMFKKAKEYADKKKIKVIATGEVLGERPLSQTKHALAIIDKRLGFELLRPLSAKLLEETQAEKQHLVDREKFLSLEGRNRKIQMQLAKKFRIRYPTPGGGCLLCEKELSKRFTMLLQNNLINEKTIELAKIGRHFYFPNRRWFVVARNEKESGIIDKYKNSIKSGKGKPAVYYHNNNKSSRQKAMQLQKAYQEKKPEKFLEFKI